MSTPGLFDGPAPRVRAVPASAPFLDVLAEAMVEALGRDDPFALSDALVFLPNRRAARGLIDAFAKRLGGAALLPAIRPIGDLDEDIQVWGAHPAEFTVPPAIDATRQRMELAALIRARDAAAGGVEDPARALALADELRKLIDSAAAAEEVDWSKLSTLVTEAELARHWEASAKFLSIVAEYWPQRLAADGLIDPGARRAALARALAKEWDATPPTRPVIVAGSTGSLASTRTLMQTVARLPRGVVVLPGVDTDIDEDSWEKIGDQHPQHALKETLAAFGLARGDVPAMGEENASGRARRVLMREALAPAEKTADWLARLDEAGGPAFVREGAHGLRLIEAATENEEAGAIALLLREAIETEGCTAALVTPDVALARRVEAKLSRWGVQAAISHGRPLRETEAGALVMLLAELAQDACEPVALAALLKHPRVGLARDAGALTTLEHEALRGPRRFDDFAQLRELVAKWNRAARLVDATRDALAPLIAVMRRETLTLADFADALTQAMENAAGGDAWQGRDGEDAASLLREVIEHGGELGALAPHAAPRVLLRLMDGRETPPPHAAEARIAIWGPLEARLQRRDLMILGGLNEGVWPAPPGDDPFLSRAMRAALGLPSLDQRIGLAAHDFAQLANAPGVVLTRSLRREGAPTLASRWLWRLQTLLQGAQQKLEPAADHLAWARELDKPEKIVAAEPPQPKPPAGKRLTRISVTAVETLIRDPYAIYARRILGLEHLDPIGAPAGPRQRGTAVHTAIDQFKDGNDAELFLRLLDEALRTQGISPERRASERERLRISADTLIAWFAERAARKAEVYREEKGELLVGEVKLTGTADRIEIAPGYAAVLDFKTGAPPTDSQVESGLSPQLLLEAAMLAEGAFPNVPRAETTELVYWRVGNADPTPRAVVLDKGPYQAGIDALRELRGLLARYAQPGQPFLSKPRVLKVKLYDDYDQLARRKEWADEKADGND